MVTALIPSGIPPPAYQATLRAVTPSGVLFHVVATTGTRVPRSLDAATRWPLLSHLGFPLPYQATLRAVTPSGVLFHPVATTGTRAPRVLGSLPDCIPMAQATAGMCKFSIQYGTCNIRRAATYRYIPFCRPPCPLMYTFPILQGVHTYTNLTGGTAPHSRRVMSFAINTQYATYCLIFLNIGTLQTTPVMRLPSISHAA